MAPGKEIEKLVEHRTVRHSARSEASTYTTNQPADVHFRFGNPVICRMLAGRKTMRVDRSDPIEFVKDETIMFPAECRVDVVFPGAAIDRPAECLCIEIERGQLDDIVARINEHSRRVGLGMHTAIDWSRLGVFRNDHLVNAQSARLGALYGNDNDPFRDIMIDLAHQELLVTILQAQQRDLLVQRRSGMADTGLAAAAAAIRDNPRRRYSTAELARIACMSDASLFRHFRACFGMTPARFANEQRMTLARAMLDDAPVTQVAFDLGFASVEHFSRTFRQAMGQSPSQVRKAAALHR
jgi:AraC-like DNA-binding protein